MTKYADHSAAIQAKIIAAMTNEWQRAKAVCVAMYGPDVEYGVQGTLYYHLRNLVIAKQIEHESRPMGGRPVNFYRRVQANG